LTNRKRNQFLFSSLILGLLLCFYKH
jgi:hypothetical protein